MSHIDKFQHLKIQHEDIQSATNNFSAESCIGHGGFGKVYKGEVVHSKGKTMVALKRLIPAFGQGNSEFWKEIMLLSSYRHENIVSLLGYCDNSGEKILVYEYASKRSLDRYLPKDDLNWVQRLKICIGVARGLVYLHAPAKTQSVILHRDIKSSNILLDNNWNAKISDFGLSKFAPANNEFTFLVSNPAGTFGYIDPLYQETGLLTKESDVYSFGVVLFEVLCGRLCFANKDLQPLVGLVQEFHKHNKIDELVYSNIKDEINITSLKLFADIAYRCLSKERKERPLMIEILNTLVRTLDIQENADGTEAVRGEGVLNVKVFRTTYDGQQNPFDASNCYLILDIGDPLTVKVEWNEVIPLYMENFHHPHLYIIVNEVESVKKHRHLGTATMKLRDLTPEIPLTCNLGVMDTINNKYLGYLKVEVLYKPLMVYYHIPTLSRSLRQAPGGIPKDGGLLFIIIHGVNMFNGNHLHSSVSLLFRGELRKSPTMMNTSYPRWLQEFTFMLEQPPIDENLHLEVINDSWMGLVPGMGSLGRVDISLADVVNKKWTCRSYLVNDKHKYYLQVELHWRTSD